MNEFTPKKTATYQYGHRLAANHITDRDMSVIGDISKCEIVLLGVFSLKCASLWRSCGKYSDRIAQTTVSRVDTGG